MTAGVLGVILLAVLQLHNAQANFLRLPTCPPPSSDPGKEIFYPNPENCSNYYHCDNGQLMNLDCPAGLYFCSKKAVCAWPWDCTFDDCKIINRHRLNFQKADPTCPPPSSDPGKEIFYPNPENCSNYYHCDNGQLMNLDCPAGLYFCSKKAVCAWPWDCTFDDCKIVNRHRLNFQRADPTCPPPSSDPGKEIFYPNPENCSNYYHCDNGQLMNLDCPAGLYFCSKKAVCAWPWDCTFDDCKIVNRHRLNFQKGIPTCPPPSAEPGDDILYPNPENCSNYYHCDNGNLVNVDCPPGLYYCSKQGVCAWPWDCQFDDCKIPSVRTHIRDVPVCPIENPEEHPNVTQLPNPANCSTYYKCSNGQPVLQECPGDLFYCEEKEVCTWVWDCDFANCKMPNVRAQIRDAPVCPIEDPEEHPNVTQLPNPANCSTYYKCSNGQPILQDCPAGLFYCEEKEVCTWTWDCDFANCKMDTTTSHRLGYPNIRNDILLLFRKFLQRIKTSK